MHTFPNNFSNPAARHFADAAAKGRAAALAAAQQAPSGVNTVGTRGATGLLMAVERRNHSMAEALLKARPMRGRGSWPLLKRWPLRSPTAASPSCSVASE